MIISHEHRFIFLKTRKTAGTSIEVFLDRLAGDDAIVTRVGPPVPGHRPRNYQPPTNLLARRRAKRMRFGPRDVERGMWYFNHIPAAMIRERLGATRFDSYYKFCFERDPWDKAVSWYFYRTQGEAEPPAFAEFLTRGDLPVDWKRYCIDGAPAMQFIGRYETLEADLARVLGELGIEGPVDLTSEKRGPRPGAAAVAAMYDEDSAQLVGQAFAHEVEYFGYAPPVLAH